MTTALTSRLKRRCRVCAGTQQERLHGKSSGLIWVCHDEPSAKCLEAEGFTNKLVVVT